jgi:hypothetical protein
MGMYTELYFRAGLKEDTPPAVITTLQSMCEGTAETTPFGDGRCPFMFRSSSHYHHPIAVSSLDWLGYIDKWYLFVRCDMKNYSGEIESFLDWIAPYLDLSVGDYVGHIFYEEWLEPKPLHYVGNKVISGPIKSES